MVVDFPHAEDMWLTTSWPRGFCPVHLFKDLDDIGGEDNRCGQWCVAARVAFAANARDFELYWWHLRTEQQRLAA